MENALGYPSSATKDEDAGHYYMEFKDVDGGSFIVWEEKKKKKRGVKLWGRR